MIGILIVVAFCFVTFLIIFNLTRKKTINYGNYVDEECGLEISKYLELDEASFRDEESYELQFRVKKGCEAELESVLEARYSDNLPYDSNSRIGNSSMKQLIESGTVKHIYMFFKTGKIKNDLGQHKLSVEIRICIVDINGQQYVFIYT